MRTPITIGCGRNIGWPSIAASASMPPTPHPSTPRPLIIVVCESVPTSVSGNATPSRVAHDLPEVLQVHLVADAGAGRHDAQAVERLLRPSQQGVALAVAPVLELDVALVRLGRAEQVDLHGMVDHEVDRDRRLDRERVGAGALRGAPHRGEVDDRGHAGEVLHQHARRHERDVAGRARPRGERAHVVVADVARARAPQEVLEQDQHGLRQPRRGRPPRRARRVGTGRSGRRRSPTALAPRRGRCSSVHQSFRVRGVFHPPTRTRARSSRRWFSRSSG